MNCKYCNHPLNEDSNFCPGCGATTEKEIKHRFKLEHLLYTITAVALIITSILVFLIIKNGGKGDLTASSGENSSNSQTIELYSSNGKIIYVSPEEVSSYKEIGWLEHSDYERVLASYKEKPYFAIDSDLFVFGDSSDIESIMFMSYPEFKGKFGSEIIYESNVEEGMYMIFDVITKDANYTFFNYEDYSKNKDVFVLGGIQTASDKLTFGRGIKVGQKVKELDNILPATVLPPRNEYDAPFKRYFFDENLQTSTTMPLGGSFMYTTWEGNGYTSLVAGYESSELVYGINIEHSNGIITSIDLSCW